MVISNIIGGLGNQMFQFAAGRALALRHGAELRLDASGFASYRLHQGFELQRAFACPAEQASRADVERILGWQSSPTLRRILAQPRFSWLRRRELVVEPHFHYWPGLDAAPADCYLIGYWQSEKYFAGHAATIRADFTFRSPLRGRNEELAAAIGRTNAVSLHIRRGDYVLNPKTFATHGVCSLEYYHAAVKHVAERVAAPAFFIFSDDIDWARDNLRLPFACEFVGHNRGADSYVDMHLMSLCQHHIIANSSFSWWGAWLNPNSKKIVVAPKKWFAIDKAADDLIPEGWARL